MSLKEKLKQTIPMVAAGIDMVSPMSAKAQSNTGAEPAPAAVQTVADAQSWQWGNGPEATYAKSVYDSLPKEYKAFANKGFLDRMEMQEEWEQKDFIKRDKARSDVLKANPNATIDDFIKGSAAGNEPLADYPTAPSDFANHIFQDVQKGNLSNEQGLLALQMVKLGRPLATVDKNLPYAEQLRLCGFDKMADVAQGTRESSLTPRDHAIMIAQIQEADELKTHGNNEEERRELRRRLQRESDEEWDRNHSFLDFLTKTKTRLLPESSMITKFENINGKDVAVPNPRNTVYSIRDEVTRKVADKIEKENAAAVNHQMRKRAAER